MYNNYIALSTYYIVESKTDLFVFQARAPMISVRDENKITRDIRIREPLKGCILWPTEKGTPVGKTKWQKPIWPTTIEQSTRTCAGEPRRKVANLGYIDERAQK